MNLTQQQHAAITAAPEVLVSAAAGSGKTEVLVRRVLEAVLSGDASLERLLVVTFTRSAAAELRERIRAALNRELTNSIATGDVALIARVRSQLAALPRAQIGTVHSFCLDLTQRYGHQLGRSTSRVLPDDEARELRHQLAGDLLRQELEHADQALRATALAWGGPDGVGLEDLSTQRAGGLRDLVLRLHDFRTSLPDPQSWFEQHVAVELDVQHFDPQHPLAQGALQPLRQWCLELERASLEIVSELEAHGIAPDTRTLHLARCRALRAVATCTNWDDLAGAFAGLDDCLDLKHRPKGLLANYSRDIVDDPGGYKLRIKELAEPAQAEARELRRFYGRPWREVAEQENITRERLVALWKLAKRFATAYSERKGELNAADYSDLESDALWLLARREAGGLNPSTIALEVQDQLDLVLVDEYQDTSPVQDAIVQLISPGAPAARFIVGDLKQSIYAFRLAEPFLFDAHRKRIADGPGSALQLTGNFRSRARLIAAVNHVFDGLLDEELGGEDYSTARLSAAVDYAALCGYGFIDDHPARLHLVEVTHLPEHADAEEEEAEAVDEPVYTRVAAILAEIHAAGQPIYDKQLGRTRPVEWRDMAVLLRTGRGRIEPLRRELERASIPSYAPGRTGFYERPEVSDALSLLAVVDNPRQDVPLAAVLTGPAVGLDPTDLLRIVLGSSAALETNLAPEYGADDLWAKVERYIQLGEDAALRGSLADFLVRLEGWRHFASRETPPAVLDLLYSASGLRAAAAALPNGAQRLANLDALAERARQFASSGGSIGNFVEFIRASRRAAGDSGEAPLLSDKQDVVRVLTVHQAKGLEFPVVILPDLHRRFNLADIGADVQWHYRAGIGGRHYDLPEFKRYDTLGRRTVREARLRDMLSEELRILYVALTRARERLELVAAVEPGQLAGLTQPRRLQARSWLQWIAPQLGDAVGQAAQARVQSCGLEGCWEVCYELPAAAAAIELSPTQVKLPNLDLVLERINAQYPQPGSMRLPSKIGVTELNEPVELDAPALSLLVSDYKEAEVQPGFINSLNPTAADIGTATHKLLAAIQPHEFERYGEGQQVLRLRYELVRRGLLNRQHADSISLAHVTQCASDLANLLPRALREPYTSYAELPVSLLVPGREVAALSGVDPANVGTELVQVQGAIDLMLDDGRSVLILDYKTGYSSDPLELRRLHEQQLLWYCRAASLLLPGRRIQWALYGLGGACLVGPFDYEPKPSPFGAPAADLLQSQQ